MISADFTQYVERMMAHWGYPRYHLTRLSFPFGGLEGRRVIYDYRGLYFIKDMTLLISGAELSLSDYANDVASFRIVSDLGALFTVEPGENTTGQRFLGGIEHTGAIEIEYQSQNPSAKANLIFYRANPY
jgi:hypothetical protein